MRVGMFLLAGGWPGRGHADTLRAAVDAAVAAEDAGFDDVWVAEHHFMTYGLCPSAVTLAGYLLGATRRITVGTAVSVLPTAHPVALAEQALLLDQVSGGRFRSRARTRRAVGRPGGVRYRRRPARRRRLHRGTRPAAVHAGRAVGVRRRGSIPVPRRSR